MLATRLVSTGDTTTGVSRYGKSNDINMELNRINDDARHDIDRQTFIRIEPAGVEKYGKVRTDKNISKTTTISVDRGVDHV